MGILKLYGMHQASTTRRIATVLHELQVPFELHEVNILKGESKLPAYLEMQPFGQIPCIDDDGFILYESRAICRYLAAKYPAANLMPSPTDLKAYALFEQAASIELTNFDPTAARWGLEMVIKPTIRSEKGDNAVAAEQLAVLEKKLEVYEAILGKQRYLAGETLTLADLFHLPYAPMLAAGGCDIMTRTPNVARWYNELIARPSWLVYDSKDGVKTTTSY
ncbi:glutathione S-transferase [Mycena polygramma]|nr:glutathione S-transferase [Mycena polygramma]